MSRYLLFDSASEDHHVAFVSPQLLEILALDTSELIHKPVWGLFREKTDKIVDYIESHGVEELSVQLASRDPNLKLVMRKSNLFHPGLCALYFDDVPEGLPVAASKVSSVAYASKATKGMSQLHIKSSTNLSFHIHNYTVRVPALEGRGATTKVVLQSVTGHVKSGDFLALMGPSGSGKTTLLSILAGRVRRGVEGTVLINGSPARKDHRRKMGYVLQDDTFFGMLTVRETIKYTALLRLPRAMTRAQKLERVEEVIEILGLTKCAGTVIGTPFTRGVSGGERKRVNIACEVLNDPDLIMLDEPTSGLDASTAVQIIRVLRLLAEQGKTIITSIHQPSSHMFAQFDKLLLLGKGRVLFNGSAKQLPSYLTEAGYPAPVHWNIADFIIELATDSLDTSSSSCDRLIEFYERQHPFNDTRKASVENMEMEPTEDSRRTWPTTWLEQFIILSQRSAKQKRGQSLTGLLTVQCLLVAMLVSFLWFNLPHDERALDDRIGLYFFSVVFWGFFPLFGALLSFPGERAVINKERSAGAFRLSAYFMAKSLSEILPDLVYPTMYWIIVYWVTGLQRDFGVFISTLLILLISVQVAVSLGLCVSTFTMNVGRGQVVCTVIMLSCMLIGGFYVDSSDMPVWIRWARYLSFIKYAFELMMLTELPGQTFRCATDTKFESCPITADAILERQGVELSKGESVLGLFLFVVVIRFFSYVFLRTRNKPIQS